MGERRKREGAKESDAELLFHSNMKIQTYAWVQVRAEQSLKYLVFTEAFTLII